MATHSFYIPDGEDKFLMRALNRVASEKRRSVSEIITQVLRENLKPFVQGASSGGWASAFAGKWSGRDAKAVARAILSTRSRRKSPPLS